MSLSFNINEDQTGKVSQKLRNKIMHSLNGNRTHVKPKKHYKILQINNLMANLVVPETCLRKLLMIIILTLLLFLSQT